MANNDNPNIIQVEDMMKFCENHKALYIYDCKEPQQLIAKFLGMCNIEIKSMIVEDKNSCDAQSSRYPLKFIEEVVNETKPKKKLINLGKDDQRKDIGIIISTDDYMYNYIYEKLTDAGLNELFFLTEWNKRTIPHKMRPRTPDMFWLEVNIADHCNLNCQCCDHFAPIADKYLLDVDEFEKDMTRLADLMNGEMGIFKIQGGEPTLHPQLIDFMRITREKFPKSTIFFFTNGILLLQKENDPNGNLWQAMKDYDITLLVTTYPVKLDFEKLDSKAKEYEIKYNRFVEVGNRPTSEKSQISAEDKMSVHHPFDLNGNVPKHQFVSCYQFNESITLRHGKIYTCPFTPYVNYFNKYFNQNLEITQNDYIDIYEAKTYEEIAEFCTHRADFCKYCDIKNREAKKFTISKKEITEWT